MSLPKKISFAQAAPETSICNRCREAIKINKVKEIKDTQILTNEEASLLKYFINKRDIFNEVREAVAFVLGVYARHPDDNDTAHEHVRTALGCEPGLDPVQYDPNVGFKISARCGLFANLQECDEN